MFALILLTLFSVTKAQTNERIFKNALQSLSADISDQNYLNLLARSKFIYLRKNKEKTKLSRKRDLEDRQQLDVFK